MQELYAQWNDIQALNEEAVYVDKFTKMYREH